MADQLPQFQDSQPILQPQQVASAAESYEGFARVLGSFAKMSEQKAEDIASDESNAMYVHSVSNIEQLKKTAQMRLLQNPGDATRISDQTAESINIVNDNSYVNEKDRRRLEAYAQDASDSVALEATRTAVHQSQLQAAFTHYVNFPDQLQAYQQALLTDHDKAEGLKSAMVKSLNSLVSVGALTPEQAGTNIKAMQGAVQNAHDYHQMYGNAATTAQDFHTVNASPLNTDRNNPTLPINGSTQWLIDYGNADKSFQGISADIMQRRLPDPETFMSLNENQRQHAMMLMQGVQRADGLINSGASFGEVQQTYKALSSKREVLNYSDQATRNALGNYIDQLKNGNYLQVISQTPAGNALLHDFNARNEAIVGSPIDDNQKAKLLSDNKNRMVSQAISYGEAHHMPGQYIQPIPNADMARVQNAFSLGQNPSEALVVMNGYSKQNQRYVVNGMKDPGQRLIMEAVSNVDNDISTQAQIDFVAANQKGRAYLTKEFQPKIKDSDLGNRIYNNLSPQMQLLSYNYGFEENGQVLQNSMIKTTMNYAKFLAQKNNDYEMKNWKDYVDEASRIYQNGFESKSSTNYVINPKQLPDQLTKPQLDALANFVINQGKDRLKIDVKNPALVEMWSNNPLKMILSPTNELLAVDGNNKVYFSVPYSNSLIPLAVKQKEQQDKEEAANRFLPSLYRRYAK